LKEANGSAAMVRFEKALMLSKAIGDKVRVILMVLLCDACHPLVAGAHSARVCAAAVCCHVAGLCAAGRVADARAPPPPLPPPRAAAARAATPASPPDRNRSKSAARRAAWRRRRGCRASSRRRSSTWSACWRSAGRWASTQVRARVPAGRVCCAAGRWACAARGCRSSSSMTGGSAARAWRPLACKAPTPARARAAALPRRVCAHR
jgi:hypothetical protein